jgi:hypothetical protein
MSVATTPAGSTSFFAAVQLPFSVAAKAARNEATVVESCAITGECDINISNKKTKIFILMNLRLEKKTFNHKSWQTFRFQLMFLKNFKLKRCSLS